MKTKTLLTLALSLGAGASAAPAFADPAASPAPSADGAPPPPFGDEDGGPHGPFGPRMLKKLGVTDDQSAQIDAIRKKYGPKLKDLGQQIRTEHEALGSLLTAHGPIDAVRAENKKVQDLMAQMGDQRLEMMYEIGGVLTQDQRTQLHDMLKERGERWRHHQHEKKD
jgi:Spy/CpxP family protein refolding chaperone